jgi:hypothetical protein
MARRRPRATQLAGTCRNIRTGPAEPGPAVGPMVSPVIAVLAGVVRRLFPAAEANIPDEEERPPTRVDAGDGGAPITKALPQAFLAQSCTWAAHRWPRCPPTREVVALTDHP